MTMSWTYVNSVFHKNRPLRRCFPLANRHVRHIVLSRSSPPIYLHAIFTIVSNRGFIVLLGKEPEGTIGALEGTIIQPRPITLPSGGILLDGSGGAPIHHAAV